MSRWSNYKITKEYVLKLLMDNSTFIDEHKLFNKVDNTGYGRVNLKYQKYLTHRLAAWIYFDLDYKTSQVLVLHKTTCEYKNCWGESCIYLGDHSQNNKDAYKTGSRNKNHIRDLMRKLKKGGVYR